MLVTSGAFHQRNAVRQNSLADVEFYGRIIFLELAQKGIILNVRFGFRILPRVKTQPGEIGSSLLGTKLVAALENFEKKQLIKIIFYWLNVVDRVRWIKSHKKNKKNHGISSVTGQNTFFPLRLTKH